MKCKMIYDEQFCTQPANSLSKELNVFSVEDQIKPYFIKAKFKKIAISNSQLDNEKQVSLYQLESIRENLNELEDNFDQLFKQFKKKSQSFQVLKNDYKNLSQNCDYLKLCLNQRDKLIKYHGLAYLNGTQSFINFDSSDNIHDVHTIYKSIINLNLNDSWIETNIKKMIKDNWELIIESKKLKKELEKVKQDNLKIINSVYEWKGKTFEEIIEEKNNKFYWTCSFKLKKYFEQICDLLDQLLNLKIEFEKIKTGVEEKEEAIAKVKKETRMIFKEFRQAQICLGDLVTSNLVLKKCLYDLETERIKK